MIHHAIANQLMYISSWLIPHSKSYGPISNGMHAREKRNVYIHLEKHTLLVTGVSGGTARKVKFPFLNFVGNVQDIYELTYRTHLQ